MTDRPPERCSVAAARRGDPLAATAAPADRWLVLEQPGPWGRDAVRQSRLDPAVGAALESGMHAVHGRLVLARRPDRPLRTTPSARRWWAWADARPGHERLVEGHVDDPAELLDLPLDGPPGDVAQEALWLVCTHGRHDACCAVAGRPALAALGALRPGRVWECSHVGGDRFAANVVVLPHGLGYGRVGAAEAAAVVDAHTAGRVVPALLRGRSSLPAPVQAAQDLLRRSPSGPPGTDAIGALAPVDLEALDRTTWRVVLRGPDGVAVAVTVRAGAGADAALLTCAASRPAHQRTWTLLGIVREP